jgi:hypothetical protein
VKYKAVIGAQLPELVRFMRDDDPNQFVPFVCACQTDTFKSIKGPFLLTGDPLASFGHFLTRLFERYPLVN